MSAAVSVRELTRVFPGVKALDGVTFDVPEGSLFGLLGPNGAGKTTLFSVAAGFIRPTEGTVEVLGVDVREISRLCGRFSMLPQDAAFQRGVPVFDQLVMFGRLNGYAPDDAVRQAREALELVGLGDVADQRGRVLSHGMMKRVQLCQAFLGRPEVIFLDEPTSGLDPKTAREARLLIRALRKERTIVISSHNLREVQELCDHAAILNEGVLEACGSMAELTSANFLVRVQLGQPLTPEAEAGLRALPYVTSLQKTDEHEINLELDVRDGERDDVVKRLTRALVVDYDLPIRSIHEGASLEARFLEITGGEYDGASAT